MLVEIFSALLMLALIIVFGINIVRLLGIPNVNTCEKAAFGFLIGNGIFTYAAFLLNLRGIAFSRINFFIIIMILIGISYLVHYLVHKDNVKISGIKPDKKNYLIQFVYIVLIYLAVTTIYSGILTPARDWDSLVLYDFRAISFVHTGHMDEAIARGYFFGYPLLSSLSHAWAYLSGWKYPTFIHALYYVSFFTSVHFILKRLIHSKLIMYSGVLFVTLSPSLLGHAFMTYTNLMYSVYLILGYLLIMLWNNSNNSKYFFLSTILIWLSTWARINEPFWIVAVLAVTYISILKRKWLFPIIYYTAITTLQRPWTNFEHRHLEFRVSFSEALPGYVSILSRGVDAERIKEVTSYLLQTVVLADKSIYVLGGLLTASVLYSAIRKKLKYADLVLPLLVMGNMALTWVGTYIFSYTVPTWKEIGNSVSRMTMFIGPLIVVWALTILDNYDKTEKI